MSQYVNVTELVIYTTVNKNVILQHTFCQNQPINTISRNIFYGCYKSMQFIMHLNKFNQFLTIKKRRMIRSTDDEKFCVTYHPAYSCNRGVDFGRSKFT